MIYSENAKLKKVCHVTSVHSRYDVRIFHKECKSLAKHGYDVTLLVNDNLDDEDLDGVKIVSTGFKPANRYERMIKSKKYIKRKMTDMDVDIFHFHDPELLPIAYWIKQKNKKVVFDFHESVARQIMFKGWIPKFIRKTLSCFYKLYETSKASKFDTLISVTPRLVDDLKKINSDTVLITNYPLLKEVDDECYKAKKRAICFAGGISKQWNHLSIIKSIESIENVEYILAGVSSEEHIQELKKQKGWSSVQYLGEITHAEVINIYKKSMLGMALLSYDTQVGKEGTLGNTKIFEYMEAGLPLICSANKLWANIIDEYNCGIAIDPESNDQISKAIAYLIDNPENAKIMGQAGRKAVEEKYNWGIEEKKLIELYAKLQ